MRIRSPRLLPPRPAIWLLISLLATHNTFADPLFRSIFTIDGGTPIVRATNDIRDLAELFDDVSLSRLSPTYVPGVSSVDALVDLRGLTARLTYDANATSLRLRIPAIGLDVTFAEGSREANQEALKDFLQGASKVVKAVGKRNLTTLLQGAVKYSPVDPVAGNPNSLQSLMLAADYRSVLFGPDIQVENLPDDVAAPQNVFFINTAYGSGFRAGEHHLDLLSLDMGSFINLAGRHWTVILELPITLTFAEGSESLLAYPGAGFTYRLNDFWSLTTMLRGGAAGSVKVGGLGFLYSATVTSYVEFPMDEVLEGLKVGWAVLGGFNKSIDDIEIDDYNLSYELANYPLRTGLDMKGPLPLRLFDMPTAWTVYGAYTHWFGTDLYMQDMAEVGVAFSLVRVHDHFSYDRVRLGIDYAAGEGYSALSARLTVAF